MLNNRRPLIFLGVGAFNTFIDFVFYLFLTSVLLRNEGQIALVGLISGTFGLLSALVTHSFITFRQKKITPPTIVKFVIFTGFGMWVIRPLLLVLFSQQTYLYKWGHQILLTLGLNMDERLIRSVGSFGMMIVILLLYNYYVYSKYVFIKSVD